MIYTFILSFVLGWIISWRANRWGIRRLIDRYGMYQLDRQHTLTVYRRKK